MILACNFTSCCSAILNSQLFATVLGLVIGSYFIERLHVCRAAERETLRWLITQVDQYADMAGSYWNARLQKHTPDDIEITKAKLRSEYPFLIRSIDYLKCINCDKIRIHDATYAIMDLFKAATGDGFDSAEVSDDEVLAHIAGCADSTSKIKQLLYAYLTEWDMPSMEKFLRKIKNVGEKLRNH